MITHPYGDWRDSECAPFIRAMLEDVEGRDTTRVVFADWLEERGDLEHAQMFRNDNGCWAQADWGLSWCGECRKDQQGWDMPLYWVGWLWYFPTIEWLRSQPCEELVRAWVKNGIYLGDYPWAQRLARELGLM